MKRRQFLKLVVAGAGLVAVETVVPKFWALDQTMVGGNLIRSGSVQANELSIEEVVRFSEAATRTLDTISEATRALELLRNLQPPSAEQIEHFVLHVEEANRREMEKNWLFFSRYGKADHLLVSLKGTTMKIEPMLSRRT